MQVPIGFVFVELSDTEWCAGREEKNAKVTAWLG